jgi:hypothetical protein
MINIETLRELEALRGLDAVVRVAGIQSLLHTKKTKPRHLTEKGAFAGEVVERFSELLGEDKGSAQLALAELMGCLDYEQRQQLQGLGGCVVIPLADCIAKEEATYIQHTTEPVQRQRERV